MDRHIAVHVSAGGSIGKPQQRTYGITKTITMGSFIIHSILALDSLV